MIQRITLFVVTLLAVGLFVGAAQTTPVHAAEVYGEVCNTGARTNGSTLCQNKGNTENPFTGPNGILVKGIQLIDMAIAIVAVVVIILAGMQFIISSGDANKVSNARNAILYAVIGLVVAVVAQTIVVFVLKKI